MPYKNYEDYKKWTIRNKERVKEYKARWRKENGWYSRKWDKEHREYRKNILKKWRRFNPEKAFILRANYRTRLKNTEGKFTLEEWEQKKKEFNHTCPMCERKEPEVCLTIDHFIPISKNGTNYITNIQPLCKSCNSSKGNRI